VDPERGAITRVVTVAEALPSDLLYGSCSDGQGQLWLGTPSNLLIIVNLS
jgi:ligand-binding sensor domain-containing protein